MKKFLRIDKEENFTICLFEHRLIEYCKHYFISFSLDNLKSSSYYRSDQLFYKKIDLNNIKDCDNAPYSKKRMREYLIKQAKFVDGFVFYHKANKEPVGCIWVMYKGGNELQYRVRNVDAFGFDFCVFDKYKGHRYIEAMIYEVLLYLQKNNINKLFASVRTNNYAAIKAYQRMNMNIETVKHFGRIISFRIPYCKI